MAKIEAFAPSARDPWDARKARHLLSRAGFGPTPEEVDAFAQMGFDDAVDRLIQYNRIPDPIGPPAWLDQPLDLPALPPEALLPRRQQAGAAPMPAGAPAAAPNAGVDPNSPREQLRLARQMLMRENRQRVEMLRDWWLDRMVHTPRPLEEKLTLFWHGHFATQAIKVRIPSMIYQHLDLLRRNATGSFRELVLGVSRDPAMLIYLDNRQNRKEHPNENYARELMELFTLGIGHYTEEDVKQSARAFTGWTIGLDGGRGVRPPGPLAQLRLATGQAHPGFLFRPKWHDDGEKQFLGQRGSFDGTDIVRIILEQPACPEFISRKLVRFFVNDDQPPPELVAGLAEIMRRSDYQLRPVLEALFRSRAFYADNVIGAQIKSPVELVAGALRQLNAQVDPPQALTVALRQMGQVPLDPPNVAGWHGGKGWINTSTLLARYNFSLLLLRGQRLSGGDGRRAGGRPRPGFARRPVEIQANVMALCPPADLSSPERLVDHLAAALLSAPLSPAQRGDLVAAAREISSDDETRVKQVAHLVMSTPNYQVC